MIRENIWGERSLGEFGTNEGKRGSTAVGVFCFLPCEREMEPSVGNTENGGKSVLGNGEREQSKATRVFERDESGFYW